jgi:hypothetical protein
MARGIAMITDFCRQLGDGALGCRHFPCGGL